MTDDALVRFTAHELPREDLHALMARSDGPALLRTAWHFGVLVVTSSLLWRLRSTPWVLPLLLAHGYMLAFVFCALHETAHRTTFRTREARVYLGVYIALVIASVLAGSWLTLLVWIAPWVVGQVFLRPYLLAEHTGCTSTRDCLENTRTMLTLALVRLFAWNMPYHAEHHAYPAVPFHALPRLHERVRGRIENLDPGYIAATVKVNCHLFGPDAGILRHPG